MKEIFRKSMGRYSACDEAEKYHDMFGWLDSAILKVNFKKIKIGDQVHDAIQCAFRIIANHSRWNKRILSGEV